MLAYIKGTLESKQTDYIVIDVGGLGYKIYMSTIAIDKLPKTGETIKVHTYYKVREDDISIYGFNTQEELRMFELLVSVSGIGAKTAISMLSMSDPLEFAIAIISDDVKYLTQMPGVGTKSAQRIILELKDKIKKEKAITELKDATIKQVVKDDGKTQEAIDALQVLGYNKKDIENVFKNIDKKELTLEELIKKGLSELSKK